MIFLIIKCYELFFYQFEYNKEKKKSFLSFVKINSNTNQLGDEITFFP